MDIFLKAVAGVLVAVILGLILSRSGKDYSSILSIAVCCAVATAAISFLRPVVDFVSQLEVIANLDRELLSVMLKSVGIGILAELVSLVCADAGNAALGKVLQLLGSSIILWLSVPLLSQLIELVENVLSTT